MKKASTLYLIELASVLTLALCGLLTLDKSGETADPVVACYYCFRDGAQYSPGAVVEVRGVGMRCDPLGWVEIQSP